ncbi:type II secretory system protein [Candidatus Scalindua japonica]|uniref:Type II secretory system protein n=2 Tax=Candidatus Scalindua japonica TaxID=1284222 RepID=A0A286TZT1_9BACT|nr:type II secretory system protein [Candidatus Scalindua japonica]
MKIINKKTTTITMVCLLLIINACQSTSNRVNSAKRDKDVRLSENALSNTPQSPSYQEDESSKTVNRANSYSSDVLKKRGIRRSGEKMVLKKQVEVSSVTISPEIRKQLIRDARRATKEKRYGDVIGIADAILKTMPADETALVLKENAQVLREETKHETILKKIAEVDARERNKYFENLKEKSIPYNDIMQFTTEAEWKDIEERTKREIPTKRLEESREHTKRLMLSPSPVPQSISQEMQMKLEERFSIEFIDTTLRDIISFLQEKSGLNFFLHKDARDENINVKLNDVPLSVILEYILPKGSGYLVKDNVVHITKEPLELRVYDVRDLLINMEDRLNLTGQLSAQESYEEAKPAGANKGAYDRVKEIIKLITSTIEPQSWKSGTGTGSGGRGLIAAREGMLGDIVVTHVANVHRRVEDLLAALRSSADLQIKIEARFIAVSDNFLETFGHNIIDFDGSPDHSTRNIADTPGQDSSGNLLPGIFSAAGDTFSDSGVVAGAAGAAGSSGLNLTYQIFDSFFLKGFLKAVQESDEAETVTAPKITLSNTQRGTIKVVTTESYIQSYTIVSQTPQPVMAEIDEGTTFNVRPVVSADRKYVYLEVHPVITDVTLVETDFTTVGSVPSGGGGAAAATNKIQRPQTIKQELSVTVCVPDKGILMIGGLGKRSEAKSSKGVPILSKIPIVKRLFSSSTIDRDIATTGNLIILIKPTVLIREEEETRAFTKGKKNVQIRVPIYGR